eukprot:4592758-Pleurochrysis_carterae.AAC.1
MLGVSGESAGQQPGSDNVVPEAAPTAAENTGVHADGTGNTGATPAPHPSTSMGPMRPRLRKARVSKYFLARGRRCVGSVNLLDRAMHR